MRIAQVSPLYESVKILWGHREDGLLSYRGIGQAGP